ncbi:MAG: Clp protease N-terminal domain-containing protein [Phototrophicaceae bacterium]|jgi:ATP-dependent Clp protease ATP-binding subunit ClpA
MSNRPLKTLLENAHLEAANLAHHYVGVEHLFIAMIRETAHEHTLTARALHKLHLPPQYVLEKIQYCTFPNDEKRQWEGHPHSPRTRVVLNLAYDIAAEVGRGNDVSELDLLQAIVEEGDSLPMRLLKAMGMNPAQLFRTTAGLLAVSAKKD